MKTSIWKLNKAEQYELNYPNVFTVCKWNPVMQERKKSDNHFYSWLGMGGGSPPARYKPPTFAMRDSVQTLCHSKTHIAFREP